MSPPLGLRQAGGTPTGPCGQLGSLCGGPGPGALRSYICNLQGEAPPSPWFRQAPLGPLWAKAPRPGLWVGGRRVLVG